MTVDPTPDHCPNPHCTTGVVYLFPHMFISLILRTFFAYISLQYACLMALDLSG